MADLLYLCYNKAYGHQTWQGGGLIREASTNKVKKIFEHMVTRGDVIIYLDYNMSMGTWPGRIVTFNEELPFIKPEDLLIA